MYVYYVHVQYMYCSVYIMYNYVYTCMLCSILTLLVLLSWNIYNSVLIKLILIGYVLISSVLSIYPRSSSQWMR